MLRIKPGQPLARQAGILPTVPALWSRKPAFSMERFPMKRSLLNLNVILLAESLVFSKWAFSFSLLIDALDTD